ncbi:WYL domain-containing protein [Patescibacteria group bacterium]|nr:WYL domain-containing protein [Patescibacteria group bacterium]MBU1683307.1 WYL domain-containing protein [Patescibacteria group bacterium]MBU1934608.1 WYL domain-containing protein [Patescibacteria group bacterium]
MYRYLNWLLFEEVYGMCEWTQQEEIKIQPLITEAKTRLKQDEILIVENRARRMADEYEQCLLYQLNKKHRKELYDDDGYTPRHITFSSDVHETWLSAVRKQKTMKIKYDSTTSGLSERLINPYQTKGSYGIGYCHKRKKILQFRFDRVIDIELMNRTFEKPKNWKEEYEENRRYF